MRPWRTCRAYGAKHGRASRTQGSPFGSAQGSRPGLNCFAPLVLPESVWDENRKLRTDSMRREKVS